MEPLKVRGGKQPEHYIQDAIVDMLKNYGWHVMNMCGNQYQKGVPDLFACHKNYGHRWIEVKLPKDHPEGKRSAFTKAQLENFPKLSRNGSPVWILVAGTYKEYKKLFEEPNVHKYLF